VNRTAHTPPAEPPRYTARASAAALARLAAHLRLAEAPDAAGARLVAVGTDAPPGAPPSQLWFELANDRGEQAWIGVARAGGEPWACNGRTLKFCFRDAGMRLPRLYHVALRRLAPRLDGTPFERLAGIVTESTGASRPVERSPGPRSESWAHPDQWREFCCFSVIEGCPAETFLGHYAIVGPSRSVRYGDLECQTSLFLMRGVAQTPFAFTRDPYSVDPAGGGPEHLAMLEDHDVIRGTGVEKVERILECLAEDPSCGSLHFLNGCIPMMTGDDVQGPIARFRDRTGRPVVFADMSPENCHHESLARVIARDLATAPPGAAPAPAHRFNLVGFRDCRGRAELIDLLAAAGAALNVAIIPEFRLEDLAGYRNAAAQAIMPNRYYEDVYDTLRERGPITCAAGAPYGREGTTTWVRGLTALLGDEVAARLEALLAARAEQLDADWSALAARARAFRAGFVLGPGDAARLSDPAQSGGAQVPALLAEMGFGLDFLELRAAGAPLSVELRRLIERLPDPARHAGFQFAVKAELVELLRAGRVATVYSNLRNDRRLTRNGLTGFSLRDLEMGFAGAVRTIRRLVERCELPFFREHARHLRAAP
jgi:hypothetical protein